MGKTFGVQQFQVSGNGPATIETAGKGELDPPLAPTTNHTVRRTNT